MTRTTIAAVALAALSVAAVVVGIVRGFLAYQSLDDGFDDIIAAEYTSDPASWPRAIRYPS